MKNLIITLLKEENENLETNNLIKEEETSETRPVPKSLLLKYSKIGNEKNNYKHYNFKKGKYNFLVIDTGIGLDHAIWLGRMGNKVNYFVNWQVPYPSATISILGYGFEELNKIEDYGEILKNENIDCILFTDVGFGSLADFFRQQGFNVFGTNSKGEKLEQNRVFFNKKFKELGIPTPNTYIAKGIEELYDYLSKNKGEKYIKLNKFRGNIETFWVKNVDEARLLLEQANLGILKDITEFIIQDPCEGAEIGIDVFYNGKDFIRPYFFTVERDCCIGKVVYESLWDDLFLNKIKPFLENDYRGNISLEAFYDGKNIKALDITARFPYPNSSFFPRIIKNYDEVIVKVAKGQTVEIEWDERYPYIIEVPVFSSGLTQNFWREIHIDKDLTYEENYAIRSAIKFKNKIYHIPEEEMIIVLLAKGKTFEESFENIDEVIKKVSSQFLVKENPQYLKSYIEKEVNKYCDVFS
jgi:phosphoribosylamine-glycine ligase